MVRQAHQEVFNLGLILSLSKDEAAGPALPLALAHPALYNPPSLKGTSTATAGHAQTVPRHPQSQGKGHPQDEDHEEHQEALQAHRQGQGQNLSVAAATPPDQPSEEDEAARPGS